MDEMMNYVFMMMKNYEQAFGVISKNFRLQRQVNLSNGFCFIMTSAGLLLTCKALKEQNDEIKSLKKRVEELEVTEGE